MILSLLAWLILLLLTAKLVEICYHLTAAIRGKEHVVTLLARGMPLNGPHGRVADSFHQKYGWPSGLAGWPITGLFFSLPPAVCWPIVRYVFRYRTLMLGTAISVAFAAEPSVILMGMIALMIGVWLELIRILGDRVVFGYADEYFRSVLAARLFGDNFALQQRSTRTQRSRLSNFLRIFLGLTGVLIVSYTAVFSGLDTLYSDKGAFEGIPHDNTKAFHLFYFSVVTLATVGYGDIYPIKDALAPRLLVASEILASFLLLVVFLTSVTLTFHPENKQR